MNMDILTFMHDLWLVQIFLTVGYTLLWYDYFLTIGDEVEYIWKSPWTAVKATYLLKRYGTLIGQTVVGIQVTGLYPELWQEACEGYAIFLGIYLILSLEFAHNLVFLRAWALWGGSRRVLRSILVGYTAILILIVAGITEQNDPTDIDLVAGVCHRRVPDHVWLLYFTSLVLDTLVYCTSVYALQAYRAGSPNNGPLLFRVFMRSITVFYFVNVFHDVMYIIAWTVYGDSPKANMSTCIGLPVLVICSQRVVIDLRRIQPAFYGTEEVSKEVNRQINALSLNIHCTNDNDRLFATREGDPNPDVEETRIDPTRISSGDNRNKV